MYFTSLLSSAMYSSVLLLQWLTKNSELLKGFQLHKVMVQEQFLFLAITGKILLFSESQINIIKIYLASLW